MESGAIRFVLAPGVQIYEVGQEDSTISGTIVGSRPRDRLAYIWKEARTAASTFVILLLILATLVAVLILTPPANQGALGQIERAQSGVIPVMIVTFIGLVLAYPRRQTVVWTQRYRRSPTTSR